MCFSPKTRRTMGIRKIINSMLTGRAIKAICKSEENQGPTKFGQIVLAGFFGQDGKGGLADSDPNKEVGMVKSRRECGAGTKNPERVMKQSNGDKLF